MTDEIERLPEDSRKIGEGRRPRDFWHGSDRIIGHSISAQVAKGVMQEFVRDYFSRRLEHICVDDRTAQIGLFPEHRYEAPARVMQQQFVDWVANCATPEGRSRLFERAPGQMREAVDALADKMLSLMRDETRIAAADTRISAYACRANQLLSIYDEYSGVVATVHEDRDFRITFSCAWSSYRRPREVPLDERFENEAIPLHVWGETLTEARDGPHKERK